MDAVADRQRPQFPTIYSVYRLVEEFWEACPPNDDTAAAPDDLLNPLDACIIHLVLEKLSSVPVYIDRALSATAATGTVLGLVHPRVQLVAAEQVPECPALQRVEMYVARYRAGRLAPFHTLPAAGLVSRETLVPGAVILVDARSQDPEELADQVSGSLENQPDRVILILGLGRLGACQALGALWRKCSSSSSHRMWLARELSGALSTSSLGIIARKDNQEVSEALVRVEQVYTSNYHFLDLLRTQNQALLEASGVDAEILQLPHVRWHFTAEMEECNRVAQEAQVARSQLEEATRLLAEAGRNQVAREQQLKDLESNNQLAREQVLALESSNRAARERIEALERTNRESLQEVESLESSSSAAIQRLKAMESSMAFKTSLHLRRWRARLAPEQSIRFWCYRRVMRAVQIWRVEGFAGLLRGIARKCGRSAPA